MPDATPRGRARAAATAAPDPPEPTRRRWRGVDPDTRQRGRRQRLLDAALDLAGTEGVGAATVRAVCARSGLHSRYFYESFDDTAALLVALFDHLAAEATGRAAAAAALAGPTPRDKLRASVIAGVQYFADDPRRARVLVVEAVTDPELNRRRLKLVRAMVRFTEAGARQLYGLPPEREHLSGVAANFLVGGMTEVLAAVAAGDLDVPLEVLVDDLVDLLIAFARATTAVTSRRSTTR